MASREAKFGALKTQPGGEEPEELQRQTTKLGEAPVLLTSLGDPGQAGRRGTVLLYHGLTAFKEGNQKELDTLAGRGFLAVGVDAVGHGEREYPDLKDRLSGPPADVEAAFMAMVRLTIQEVPSLLDSLIDQGLASKERLGITGISMGGFVTYGALLQDRRIRAAAPILGSPRWKTAGDDSPHLQADRFHPTALLSQNAGKDESVPPGPARDLHRVLQEHYAATPDRLMHIEFPDSGHFMPEADWNRLWSNVLEWFERFLTPQR